MTSRIEFNPTIFALPLAVMIDRGCLSVGVLCYWWVTEWPTAYVPPLLKPLPADPHAETLLDLARVGEELDRRLRASPN